MIEVLSQPWPWYVSGTLIAFIMVLLLFFGKSFGFSANLSTICSACGAGKKVKFFDVNWRNQTWNLLFLVGAILGGVLSAQFLNGNAPVDLSQATVQDLSALGFAAPDKLQPDEIFGLEALLSLKGFLVMLLGGFAIGFGARYAGGCTSGHAISGLSNLQLPSLIAVVGFFIGGLITTWLLMPLLF